MISSADVAAAARSTLVAHLPARLAALPRPLPVPTRFDEVPTFEAIRRVKRSVLAISVPRTLGTPERFGDGSYDAVWLLSIAVWHEQSSTLPLLTAGGDYNAAVRGTLLEHQKLGGIASQTTWTEESTDLVGDERTNLTLGLAICEFAVRVSNVADENPLPLPDGTDGPVVQTAEVTITNP